MWVRRRVGREGREEAEGRAVMSSGIVEGAERQSVGLHNTRELLSVPGF